MRRFLCILLLLATYCSVSTIAFSSSPKAAITTGRPHGSRTSACSWRPPRKQKNEQTKQLFAHFGIVNNNPAPQILEFQEPETNVTVVLVGAMHYNPSSVQLTKKTIQEYGNQNRLGSVVIESCDIRWNKTQELYKEKPVLKALLNNEMRTAYDVAQLEFQRPVILGDQRINITTDAMKNSLKETLVDIVTPPQGWKRCADQLSKAYDKAVPFGAAKSSLSFYLSPLAFLDPRLLLALPVSLVKYPLSFLVRDPVPTLSFFALVAALNYSTEAATTTAAADGTTTYVMTDLLLAILFALIETLVFARLLLGPLLADRNVVLANRIRDECRTYANNNNGSSSQQATNWWELPFSWFGIKDDEDSNYYSSSPKVVVAVLGMAHCNGIKKLLVQGEDTSGEE